MNKIGRITGLEPAITFYHGLVDPSMRLDPSDADFVDVIHTNGMQALLLGSYKCNYTNIGKFVGTEINFITPFQIFL